MWCVVCGVLGVRRVCRVYKMRRIEGGGGGVEKQEGVHEKNTHITSSHQLVCGEWCSDFVTHKSV